MMSGSNILVVKDILVHTDIKMTIPYAHFAADQLEETVKSNLLENKK